jgi:diacylglycerol kinase (ATP)
MQEVRRIIVIANVRGARRSLHFDAICQALETIGIQTIVRRVQSPGDAFRYAAEAARSHADGHGPDRLVVAGGDGTMNDALNGLAGYVLPTAFVPFGTANVLAKELKLPKDPLRLASMIVNGPTEVVHLGKVNGRLFLLMAGVGLDAEVCERVRRDLKVRFRQAVYVVVTVQQWFRSRRRRYRVTIDGNVHRAASVVVSNSVHYGGPFVFAPDADIRTPELHVCLFRRAGRIAEVRYMLGMLFGLLPRMAGFEIIPGRHVTIESETPTSGIEPVQADGDVLARLPANIAVAEECLAIVMPDSPHRDEPIEMAGSKNRSHPR